MTDVLVLCYHAVSRRWPAYLSVTPDQFEEHMEILVKRGYRGTTFLRAATDPPAGKSVAVTFDDAYRSVIELAFPVLSRLGWPGSVFVPTDYVSTETPMAWAGNDRWLYGPYESEMICMSWQDLSRLAGAGWEVGSHTQSHPRLTQLGEAALANELSESRGECERQLGRPCRSLAYPYGDVDSRVIDETRRAGYLAAAGLPDRFYAATQLLWPRVGIYHRDTAHRFRLKVSRSTRRLRASPAWPVVTGMGRVMRCVRGSTGK